MKRENWIWMPHPGHLCVAEYCRFHLNTYVGKYIVSTVGEYVPDSSVREILANCRKIELEGRGDERKADWMKKVGFEEIGAGRKYETMVFRAEKADPPDCCPYRVTDYSEIDSDGYNSAADAYQGHLRLCKKWGAK